MKNISATDIENFVKTEIKRVSVSRVNAYLRTLRVVLKWAAEHGYLYKTPKIKLLPSENQREFVISEKLLSEMLAHEKCTDFLKLFLPFLYDTGLRLSEALQLKWRHVSLPRDGHGFVVVEKGKTKYARRRVPLTQRASEILRTLDRGEGDDPVWGTESRHWASEQFRTLRDEMKLSSECVLHSFRHSLCTRLAESGASPFELQRLAGHYSVAMSQKYTHIREDRLDEAISRL